jgi:aerobic-type carbon monoxide dehydrogenase small subunit (CoxS/CutS family)
VKRREITLTINGRTHAILLDSNTTLLTALRDLGYTDVKNGCEQGECGACAVLLDGEPLNSCMVLAHQADGGQITTNAGLGTLDRPHPIQEAFADAGAIQCGFCTSGMIVATKALLDRNPNPTDAEIRDALSGNLCRCTGYGQIISAVRLAAERLSDLASSPSSSRSEDGRESDPEARILASDDVAEGGSDS